MRSSFGKVFMGAAGGVDLPSDDEFNRVSFLSHFEGANNGVNNAFDDGSTSNHTITANGNITQGSFGPFARPDGEFAVSFDGSGDTLSAPASSDFSPGAGDFTLEAFVNLGIAGSSIAWHQNNSSGAQVNLTGSTALNANQWYHIAVVINSNTLKLYVDGTSDGSVTNNEVFNNNDVMTIGGNADHIGATNSMGFVNKGAAGGSSNKWFLYFAGAGGGITFKGQISNLRFVKGTAVYTGDFTAPTSKLTAITNTKLLTCQSNRFVDNSDIGHTLTPAGNAAVSAFGPFLTSRAYDPAVNGASASFDGDGDYLSLAYDADFNFGTGSFTIEAFVFPKDLSGAQGIYATNGGSGSSPKFIIYLDGTTPKAHVNGFGSSVFFNATATISANEWNHLAFVRNGSTWYWFVNGTQAGTGSNSTNITFNNVATVVGYGGESGNAPINGFISDLRVVKGTAVYTSNFTPPTAPLTAITNTKLLLNMADAQAIDSAAQNNLTLIGNANTSTDQAKFGNTSLHLDGSGDYVNVLPSGRGNIYNYTVEQWLYPTRNYAGGEEQFDRIWSSGTATNNSVMLHFDTTTAPKIVLRSNDSIIWTSSVSISLNAWTHVAVSCDADGTRLYIAGTERATSSTVVNLRNLPFNIGTSITTTGFFQGFMDDFRISDFARYTGNFTAPAEPFPDKGQ